PGYHTGGGLGYENIAAGARLFVTHGQHGDFELLTRESIGSHWPPQPQLSQEEMNQIWHRGIELPFKVKAYGTSATGNQVFSPDGSKLVTWMNRFGNDSL